jgi:hypothetical protein
MDSVTPNELRRTDRFIEDTYPEIWEVIGPARGKHYPGGVRAKVVGYLKGFPGEQTRLGEECDWFGDGMCLYRLAPAQVDKQKHSEMLKLFGDTITDIQKRLRATGPDANLMKLYDYMRSFGQAYQDD